MDNLQKNENSKTGNKLKDRGDCVPSKTSSNSTQFFKQDRTKIYKKVTKKEFLSESESISGSESFNCDRKNEIKYSEKGLLNRNLVKNLDPITIDPQWSHGCPEVIDWTVVNVLEYMVRDPISADLERFEKTLEDFVKISLNGFKIEFLDQIANILDYLIDQYKVGNVKKILSKLLKNVRMPIIISKESDVNTYFCNLRNYFCILGCLLLTLPNDDDFDILYEGLVWQLSASDKYRGSGSVRKRYVIAAATPMLVQSVSRMIAYSSSHRYLAFIQIATIISCDSPENCQYLLNENIIQHILYRYNPYFPKWDLSEFDKGPMNPDLPNIKLGDSTIHGEAVLSLLLVLLKTAKDTKSYSPVPDAYSIRCFAWAYRYECRINHRHRRIVMTALCSALLHCYGEQLPALGEELMADVLSLSVFTEIPSQPQWLDGVKFTTGYIDVDFKKILLYLSVDFFRKFSLNKFMAESRHWILGIMYLLDPVLSVLRPHWSPELFKEIHITAIQTLSCTLSLIPFNLIENYGIIRRLMWYIEWYSEEPYDTKILYWTLRVLHSVIRERKSKDKEKSMKDLFGSHGVIILSNLCYTLLNNSFTAKTQGILSLTLRILNSAVQANKTVICNIYPYICWPSCICSLGIKLLDTVLISLEAGRIVTDGFLISLLNFIWDAIVWNENYRKIFITQNGIYNLLDLIAMSSDCVQCIALAVICDLVTTSQAVAELITWRAKFQAASMSSSITRGCTIASLLASIFRDECRLRGIHLDSNNIIQDVVNPLMSLEVRNIINRKYPRELISKVTPVCLAASDIAGSRLSKVFVVLNILSEDLDFKVSLADETYNMYKNIELTCEDEVTLVLCLHYFTAKIHECWSECSYLMKELLPEDAATLGEFIDMGKAWTKEIIKIQEETLQRHISQGKKEESLLYNFLRRARLSTALDALKDIRCIVRTADKTVLNHCLLYDAVQALYRKDKLAQNLNKDIIRTYVAKLD